MTKSVCVTEYTYRNPITAIGISTSIQCIYTSGKKLGTANVQSHSKETGQHIGMKFGTRLLQSFVNTTPKFGLIPSIQFGSTGPQTGEGSKTKITSASKCVRPLRLHCNSLNLDRIEFTNIVKRLMEWLATPVGGTEASQTMTEPPPNTTIFCTVSPS